MAQQEYPEGFGGEEAENKKKKSDIISSAAEKFREKRKPWYTKAGEAIYETAADVGGAIKGGFESLGQAGGGVGTRLGALPGSEKEKEQKEESVKRYEDITQQKIDEVINTAKEAASEAGTTLEEDIGLQDEVRSQLTSIVGKERAGQVDLAPTPATPTPQPQEAVAAEEPAVEEEAAVDTTQDEQDIKNETDTLKEKVSFPEMAEYLKQSNLIRQEYLDTIAEAKETYARTKDEIAQRRIWDGLIKGLSLLAAAAYANSTGVALSGIKFEDINWDKKFESAREDLITAKSLAKDVKDVKLEGEEEKVQGALREFQMNKAIKDAAYDDINQENKQLIAEARLAALTSSDAREEQKDVLELVKGKRAYLQYQDTKKDLEKELANYRKNKDEQSLEVIRELSDIMENSARSLSQGLGGQTFPNEYPPSLFDDKEKTFLFLNYNSSPEFIDILKRKAEDPAENLTDLERAAYDEAMSIQGDSTNKKEIRKYFKNKGIIIP